MSEKVERDKKIYPFVLFKEEEANHQTSTFQIEKTRLCIMFKCNISKEKTLPPHYKIKPSLTSMQER